MMIDDGFMSVPQVSENERLVEQYNESHCKEFSWLAAFCSIGFCWLVWSLIEVSK
jgi:hypothetical protein